MAQVKASENEQKTRTQKKVKGSRYMITDKGNHLNLVIHPAAPGTANRTSYIYTKADGTWMDPTHEENGNPTTPHEWAAANIHWTDKTQFPMTAEYEVKVLAEVERRDKILLERKVASLVKK